MYTAEGADQLTSTRLLSEQFAVRGTFTVSFDEPFGHSNQEQ